MTPPHPRSLIKGSAAGITNGSALLPPTGEERCGGAGTHSAQSVPCNSEGQTKCGEVGIPSLRYIRKTLEAREGEEFDILNGRRRAYTTDADKNLKFVRSVGTQNGSPRLETVDHEVDDDNFTVQCSVARHEDKLADLPEKRSENDSDDDKFNSAIDEVTSAGEGAVPEEGSVVPDGDSDDDVGNGEGDDEGDVLPSSETADKVPNNHQNMEPRGSIFEGVGASVVANEWKSKWHKPYKIKGRQILRSIPFTFFVFLTTIYAIVGMEIAESTVGTRDFFGLELCSLISFLFFCVEVTMSSICVENYFLSFFFYLDVIGTISLLPDIAFLWPDAWALDGLALARAGRVARTGTRAVRIVRLFRIVRILKLFRIVKLLSSGRRKLFTSEEGEDHDEAPKKRKGSANETASTEINSYRSRLAKRHAAVVEMRVVTGVIMMLLLLPLFEYVDVSNNKSLDIIQNMISNGVNSTVIHDSIDIYRKSENTLVYFEAEGQIIFEREAEVQGNIIQTGVDIPGKQSITAKYDLTEEIKETAVLSILLTLFLTFLFVWGSFVFNNDAHELMYQPIARLTQVTNKVSSQLFSIAANSVNGSEASYIESVMTKVAKFFETDVHKVTTLYTPDDTVWTIDIRREKEGVARVVGSTHRITSGDLHNMMKGSKKNVVQKLMFTDFLNDPLAVRYFNTYLQDVSAEQDKSVSASGRERKSENESEFALTEDNLVFWEEIRRYRKAMSSATFLARHIFKTYVHPDAENAVELSKDIIRSLFDSIIVDERPSIGTFDEAEHEVTEIMRMRSFPHFLESDVCAKLVTAKNGLPKAIMVENEYGQEEEEELERLMGTNAPVELNLAVVKTSKDKRSKEVSMIKVKT